MCSSSLSDSESQMERGVPFQSELHFKYLMGSFHLSMIMIAIHTSQLHNIWRCQNRNGCFDGRQSNSSLSLNGGATTFILMPVDSSVGCRSRPVLSSSLPLLCLQASPHLCDSSLVSYSGSNYFLHHVLCPPIKMEIKISPTWEYLRLFYSCEIWGWWDHKLTSDMRPYDSTTGSVLCRILKEP